MTYNFILRFSSVSIFLITNILVSNSLFFSLLFAKEGNLSFDGRHVWKNHN
jgi:hypothetical protein